VYEWLLYSFRRRPPITHRLTVSEIQAVLMLKTAFCLPHLYMDDIDLEFEGHAVGMWRRNLAPEIIIVGRTMWAQSTSVTDGRTYLR